MKQERRTYILLAAYSFVLLLFTTHSSPLFAFNGWNDVNSYFTVGKGWFNGYVPFVDLIEQKGHLVYLIYGIGWAIDHTGFFGVYLMQAAFLAVSVIYVYRLAQLFVSTKEICFLAAIASPIPLLSYGYANIGNTGGSAEEFVLTLLTVSFYYFTLFFIKPKALLPRHMVLQGVLFAAVFMMKFNLTAFFGGFVIVAAVSLLRSGGRVLWKYTLCFAGGAALVFAPFLVYLLATESLSAFIEIYFVTNFLYAGNTEVSLALRIAEALHEAARQFIWRFVSLAFMLLAYLFLLIRKKWVYLCAYSVSLLFLVISIYLSNAFIHYAGIPLSVFLNMGIIALCNVGEKLTAKRKVRTPSKFAVVVLVFALTVWRNGLVRNPEFLYRLTPVQREMAEIIWQNAKGDDPTLLQVASMDSGFYTASGIIPREPWFHTTNISDDLRPE
ncbi:MAG: glycosyltransferase family 39 protein, partial [Lachnospiraceae bacterium]|nr:glycosyltransferase family 39 protein [Lachnospiraceae bacterium]